jgi:hypothetical protein
VLICCLVSVGHQLFGLQNLKANQEVKQLRGRSPTGAAVSS